DDKGEALRRLIRSEDVKNAIIFCNRKRDVDILHRSLTRHGFNAAALHGDMPQSKRTETLERFKDGAIRLLVASDVAARGLDIQGMSHVFNFDVPIHAEDYVHRIGRTGRAGREGRAFTLATSEDGRFVQAIEHLIGKAIPPVALAGLPVPEPGEATAEPARRRGGRGHRTEDRKPRAPREAAPRSSERKPRETGPRETSPRSGDRKPRDRHEGKAQATPRFAPVTMEQIAMEEPSGNVTPLPRRDERRRQEDDDDHDGIVG